MRFGKITKVLFGVIVAGGVITTFAIMPGLTYAIAPLVKHKKYRPKQVIERNIESLIKKGLLKRSVEKDGTETLEVTPKGKWQAILHGIYSHRKQVWDGKWRIIIFDVPNRKTRMRDELRSGLVLYGFKQIQKSVWAFPYPCEDFIALVKSHLGVTQDVVYLETSTLENDKYLQREFKV